MSEIHTRLESGDEHGASAREVQIARVVSACCDQIHAGEELRIEDVLARHRELTPELTLALEAILDVMQGYHLGLSLEVLDRGDSVGSYEIVRLIGAGGMGSVYEAIEAGTGRRVALKVLQGGLLANAQALERFEREARAANKLNHPNIVSVFGCGMAAGLPYIAMELIEGKTLAAFVDDAASVPQSNLVTHIASSLPLPAASPGAAGRSWRGSARFSPSSLRFVRGISFTLRTFAGSSRGNGVSNAVGCRGSGPDGWSRCRCPPPWCRACQSPAGSIWPTRKRWPQGSPSPRLWKPSFAERFDFSTHSWLMTRERVRPFS